MSQSLRIVFAGTPDFAARHLAALLSSEHEVIAVYTNPDRPAGRGKKLAAPPVKQLALEHNIPVYQPESFKSDEAKQELADLNADLMVVVAYGMLLPQAVLDTPNWVVSTYMVLSYLVGVVRLQSNALFGRAMQKLA